MARINRFWRGVASVAGAVMAGLSGGCSKEMGGQLGQLAGDIGGSYLSRTGIPVTESLGNVSATVGGLVGEGIAQYLDAREREQAEAAARAAIGSNKVGPGSTRTWSSQTNPGVSGGSTVIGQSTAPDGRECRTQRNYVNVKGKDVEQTEVLCRDPKTGVWAAAPA